MKILQLNIWGGRLGLKINELIKREEPDIICFQEVITHEGGPGFVFNTLTEVIEETGEWNIFFSPQFGFPVMKRQAEWGLAILSRLPLLETTSTFFRLGYNGNFDISDTDYNARNLQHVVVDNRINVLNYHGHHIKGHKDGDAETLRQCGLIVEYINKLNGPVILCGDFNLKPNTESLNLINEKLKNQTLTRSVTTTRTDLTSKKEVCDYIFTSHDLKIKSFKVLDDVVSDHKALVIEF